MIPFVLIRLKLNLKMSASKAELFDATLAITNISQFFCLASVDIEYNNNKIIFKKSSSYWYYRLRLFIFSIVVISTTIIGQMDFFISQKNQVQNATTKNVYESDRIINSLISFSNINSAVLLVILFNVSHFLDHSKFVDSLNWLVNFEIRNYEINYASTKLFSKIMIGKLLFIIGLKIALLIYIYWANEIFIVTIAFFSVHVPLIFITITSIQWISCMLLIKKFLNDVCRFVNLNIAVYKQNNNLEVLVDYVREIYNDFYFVSVDINNEYSVKIFILITLLFLLVTAHGFYSFQTFLSHHKIAIIPIVNVFIYSMQIFTFIWPCVLIDLEVRKLVKIMKTITDNVPFHVSI